jgi:hypothetical protein
LREVVNILKFIFVSESCIIELWPLDGANARRATILAPNSCNSSDVSEFAKVSEHWFVIAYVSIGRVVTDDEICVCVKVCCLLRHPLHLFIDVIDSRKDHSWSSLVACADPCIIRWDSDCLHERAQQCVH